MEYIKKETLVKTFEKLLEARARKANCSKQSATEYQVFKYALAIIDQAETINIETD